MASAIRYNQAQPIIIKPKRNLFEARHHALGKDILNLVFSFAFGKDVDQYKDLSLRRLQKLGELYFRVRMKSPKDRNVITVHRLIKTLLVSKFKEALGKEKMPNSEAICHYEATHCDIDQFSIRDYMSLYTPHMTAAHLFEHYYSQSVTMVADFRELCDFFRVPVSERVYEVTGNAVFTTQEWYYYAVKSGPICFGAFQYVILCHKVKIFNCSEGRWSSSSFLSDPANYYEINFCGKRVRFCGRGSEEEFTVNAYE